MALTSRRGLLAALGAFSGSAAIPAAVAAIPVAVPHPDAELIRAVLDVSAVPAS